MNQYRLTKTRFVQGLWEGEISCDAAGAPPPEVLVTVLDQPVRGVLISDTGQAGRWLLAVPVPPEAIGDGVHTFLIRDARTDAVLDSFALIAGEVLGDDIRAEVALLRAELDMLKRAFRRHCLETG